MEQIYELRVGESVDVVIGGHRLMSVIKDIPANDTFVLTMPSSRGTKIEVHPDQLVNIVYYRTSGLYSFVGLLDRRLEFAGADCVEIVMKSPISKYQRRDFIRIDTELPVTVRVLSPGAENVDISSVEAFEKHRQGLPRDSSADLPEYHLKTADLSGGGMSLVLERPIGVGSIIECKLELKPGVGTFVDSIVTRVYDIDGKSNRYMTCVQFVNIDEQIRRRIIKHVFKAHKQAVNLV